MPWKETCAMDERMRFVIAASAEGAVLTAVCAAFGISRTTGYTWLSRYRAAGPAGLVDRSRAPHCHGRARPEALVEAALALRGRYPTWGPRKLRVKLAELWPQEPLPAASTIGDWLRDAGLTRAPRRRRSSAPFTQPLSGAAAPNDVWTIDFKGWFRTGDGRRCDPLTVQDAASRYLLDCRGLDKPDHAHVRPCLEALFGAYGLPRAIRSDNGPPFASLAAGGLSALALWWLKLGIRPERITPGQPQENGRHERLHRTLKQETARPPAADGGAQQARFDAFRRCYNEERPHEALAMRPPAALYVASPRGYPCRLHEPVYAAEVAVRRVRHNGEIKWRGDFVFVSQVLAGEPVGVSETETGAWLVHYGDLELGLLDADRRRLKRQPAAGCGHVDNAVRCPHAHSPSNNSSKNHEQ